MELESGILRNLSSKEEMNKFGIFRKQDVVDVVCDVAKLEELAESFDIVPIDYSVENTAIDVIRYTTIPLNSLGLLCLVENTTTSAGRTIISI